MRWSSLAIVSLSLLLPASDQGICQAEQAADRLKQQEENFLQLQSHLANQLGNQEDSEALYRRLVAHHQATIDDPSASVDQRKEASKQLIRLHLANSKLDEAAAEAFRLQTRHPDDRAVLGLVADVYYHEARALLEQGNQDAAIEKYRSVLSLNGLLPEVYAFTNFALAQLSLQKGETDLGLSYYRQVIEMGGDRGEWSAAAHFGLGQHYLKHHYPVEATQEFEHIVANQATTSWVKLAVTQLQALRSRQ